MGNVDVVVDQLAMSRRVVSAAVRARRDVQLLGLTDPVKLVTVPCHCPGLPLRRARRRAQARVVSEASERDAAGVGSPAAARAESDRLIRMQNFPPEPRTEGHAAPFRNAIEAELVDRLRRDCQLSVPANRFPGWCTPSVRALVR
ncbi:MAG: hypothetical protein ACRDQA_27600 [Nocardioidaceae bacterium]